MMHHKGPRHRWKDLARGHGMWMTGPGCGDPSKQDGRVAEAVAGLVCPWQLRAPHPGVHAHPGESLLPPGPVFLSANLIDYDAADQ